MTSKLIPTGAESRDLKTSMAEFKRGDYVWAKLTGYPFWPAKINSAEQTGPKGPSREVLFLGTKQRDTLEKCADAAIWKLLPAKDDFSFRYQLVTAEFLLRCPVFFPREALFDVFQAVIFVKNLKVVNEDRAKMVKQSKSGKFLQAVAELNEVSPPPPSLVEELENVPDKKGKKGKKRKKEEPRVPTNGVAKKTKVEKPAEKQPAKKATVGRPKKPSASNQDGRLTAPSGDKNEALVSSFDISQSETDGDSRVFSTESKQYHKYGFIGLGSMGYGMAANLLKAGFNITVWNRTVAKVDELAAKGARKGESAAAVASHCDVTFACLSTPEICKEVVLGPQGIINGISSGKGYVDMSTIDPETSKELEQAVVAAGGRYLEAPVLGSIDAVTSGQLIVMAAGNPALFDEVRQTFEAISTKSYFLGETGNASRMKLVNNTMINGVTASLAESMALAKKCGVSQREFYEILNYGPLSSRQIKNKGLAILEGKFSASFTVDMMQKDMRLALALAKEHSQKMPVTTASNELLQQLQSHGHGSLDYAAMYKVLSEP